MAGSTACRKLLRTRLRSLARSRPGFTLVELMIVVSIIGIIAAIASPSIVRMVRDRRTQSDALGVQAVLQESRGRSFGRGSAVMIRWNAGTGIGGLLNTFESLEDMDRDGIGDTPSPRCAAPASDCAAVPAAPGSPVCWRKTDTFFQIDDNERRTVIDWMTQLHSGTPVAQPTMELCMTPRGRMYSFLAQWNPYNTVNAFRMRRANGGNFVVGAQERWVFMLPNGLVRMENRPYTP